MLLALTLPRHYVAGHWRLTWVGFDIILLAALAATAWFAWRRRQAVVINAFITATLLTCDAWFDITTASGQKDTLEAIASAVLIELPLAALLFWVAYRLLRAAVRRACGLDGHPGEPVRLGTQPLLGVRRSSGRYRSPGGTGSRLRCGPAGWRAGSGGRRLRGRSSTPDLPAWSVAPPQRDLALTDGAELNLGINRVPFCA